MSINPNSERLQRLTPFPAWDGRDFVELPVLLKAAGKCTTDQISAAGKWLRYRGHLENISANLFNGVVNAFTGATGEGKDPLDGADAAVPRRSASISAMRASRGARSATTTTARARRASTRRWSRASAAASRSSPRSFARIHETNLKKQGLLPLTFADRATYDEIGEDDRISILDLASLAPDRPVPCRITKPDGASVDFACTHTFSTEQLAWFHAGGALNVIRARRAG